MKSHKQWVQFAKQNKKWKQQMTAPNDLWLLPDLLSGLSAMSRKSRYSALFIVLKVHLKRSACFPVFLKVMSVPRKANLTCLAF